MSTNKTPLERFHEKYVISDMGCWLWTAGKTPEGYAKLKVSGKTVLAHRWYYKQTKTIPDGLTLDHLCRNRGCVNPSHLEAVTMRVNTLRGAGPSAKNAIKTHCLSGHEFTEENTYAYRGKRICKTCNRERQRAQYQKEK